MRRASVAPPLSIAFVLALAACGGGSGRSAAPAAPVRTTVDERIEADAGAFPAGGPITSRDRFGSLRIDAAQRP